jgi:hypothetical protein
MLSSGENHVNFFAQDYFRLAEQIDPVDPELSVCRVVAGSGIRGVIEDQAFHRGLEGVPLWRQALSHCRPHGTWQPEPAKIAHVNPLLHIRGIVPKHNHSTRRLCRLSLAETKLRSPISQANRQSSMRGFLQSTSETHCSHPPPKAL